MVNWDDLCRLAARLNGIPVLGTRADSDAAAAGVRYGDILLSVNGTPTPDWKSYVEACADPDGSMRIELFRNGEVMVLDFQVPTKLGPVDPDALMEDLATHGFVAPAPRRRRQEPGLS